MDSLKQSLIGQLDEARQRYQDYKDVQPTGQAMEALGVFVAAARASVERATGANSAYSEEVRRHVREIRDAGTPLPMNFSTAHIEQLAGVVHAVRRDVAADYLRSVREMIHGEMFGDFLEMAEYLLHEGYKDPAAVMGGSVLELHMRGLCERNGIAIEFVSGTDARPKKAETMNADLAGANVYSKLDQKNVTAWLGLRNSAAHGEYKYTKEQVELMLQGIRDFITRHPA